MCPSVRHDGGRRHTPRLSTIERPRPRRSAAWWALRIAALAAVVLAVVWANEFAARNLEVRAAVQRFGYAGLLAVSAVSGFNILVPIPVVAFFPFLMQSGLSPVPALLVIAAGMTIGDLAGFLLGRAGRKLVERPAWLVRMERLQARHALAPYVLLFVYAAFVPLPNELVVIPMALIGCRLVGVVGAALGGNLIFNSLAAAGFQGVFGLF